MHTGRDIAHVSLTARARALGIPTATDTTVNTDRHPVKPLRGTCPVRSSNRTTHKTYTDIRHEAFACMLSSTSPVLVALDFGSGSSMAGFPSKVSSAEQFLAMKKKAPP